MAVLIEVKELANACLQYLRAHNVPEYKSADEARNARNRA
jgi:hypothetical protein